MSSAEHLISATTPSWSSSTRSSAFCCICEVSVLALCQEPLRASLLRALTNCCPQTKPWFSGSSNFRHWPQWQWPACGAYSSDLAGYLTCYQVLYVAAWRPFPTGTQSFQTSDHWFWAVIQSSRTCHYLESEKVPCVREGQWSSSLTPLFCSLIHAPQREATTTSWIRRTFYCLRSVFGELSFPASA